MSGIELSQMDEDLVFDDRPPVKPKAAVVPAQPQPPVSSPSPATVPVVPAQTTAAPVNASALIAPMPASAPVAAPIQTSVPAPASSPISSRPVSPAAGSLPAQAQARPETAQPLVAAKIRAPEPEPTAKPTAESANTAAEPMGRAPGGSSAVLLQAERKKVRTDTTPAQKRETLELFETLIASAAKGGASDILLKRGQVPMFRWNGELFPSRNGPRLESAFLETLSAAILSPAQCEKLNSLQDADFSYQSQRSGRIRVNIFHQCGELGLVARLIPTEIPTFEKLDMDPGLKQLVEHKRGLVLVTGATGSGKSTTLAAMLDYINNSRTAHVITVEDPIEFVHHDKRSMFNQRELGLDVRSYADALRSALRQAPDVILVGELRDAETMEVALQAAETGHLVLSTLHTNDAADAILRILGLIGQEKESVVRSQLADSLRGVVSQRLIKRADRTGRVAAQEVMINTATIRERLLKGAHPSVVRDFIAQGGTYGMRTFDQHLIQLVKAGIVDYEEALRNASNRDDFTLRFNGVSDGREAS